ncbi:MAG TPA: hypothetical protein VIH61_00215, partial [Waddliaceae bacterium]
VISLEKERPGDPSPIHLADYFCKMAKRRINDRFLALSDNDDKQANRIAKNVINNEYRWLEDGIMWIGPNE